MLTVNEIDNSLQLEINEEKKITQQQQAALATTKASTASRLLSKTKCVNESKAHVEHVSPK